jgi:NADH:ubiquinone oxidoreductase subunit 5 (subunit L)/multisubunit Na+/H+ antiporter MnhA subunit
MSLIASHKIRFIGIMMAFTFNMIVLMVSQDLILIFIAWEMIGIISCLLIGYYNNRIEANRSGLKAIFYNRVGDISLFYFIVSVINLLNDISISLFSFLYLIVNSDSFQLFFLITSIMGKSAQIGFQPWLLDAMEGPTPVSALLHSATLVTAGIILLYNISSFK